MTALHGFLGLPSDWDAVLDGFESVWKPSWLPLAGAALPELADALNAQACEHDSSVLIGYSMGGRIALHMLVQDRAPKLWQKAVIVSASPGLSDAQERSSRVSNDCRWAERFLSEPWDDLVPAWNAQAVFATDPPGLTRQENEFNRSELAATLTNGSVGSQADLRESLSRLEIPVLWMAGERDSKYCALAEQCAALNSRFRYRAIPDAGHRVPWTNPEQFRSELSAFLNENN